MKRHLAAAGAALVVGLGAITYAQAPAATAKSQAPPATATDVTVIGCVEFESDYRKRMEAGRGGTLGTGVGSGDEFVLTNVRPAESKTKPGPGGGVYSLTGPQEKNLKRDVGRQIEVVGKIENAGKPSTGASVTDISDLPRIAIATWHPVGDFCPGK